MRRQVTECHGTESEQILRFRYTHGIARPISAWLRNSSQFQNPERPTCNYVTLTVVSCCKHCAVSL